MARRRKILLASSAILVAPFISFAQPRIANPARIGYLTATNPESAEIFLVPFKQGMSDLGYVEGRDYVIEVRYAYGKVERLPELAAELVRMQLDVITAFYSPAVSALQKATTTTPIVLAGSGDPVSQGFVKSLARPGGNTTGLSGQGPDYIAKHAEMLVGVVPRLSRVAVLNDVTGFWSATTLKNLQTAFQSKGVTFVRVDVHAPDELENAFSVMLREKAGAAVVLLGGVTFPARRRIAEFAKKNRIPSISGSVEYPEAGGLMGYGSTAAELFRRSAAYVDRILKGAKPADLPIEQPTKFELVINLATARALGIKIPQPMLLRADRVIE